MRSADGQSVGTLGAAGVHARGFIWTDANPAAWLTHPNQNWFTAARLPQQRTIVVGGATAPLLAEVVAARHAYSGHRPVVIDRHAGLVEVGIRRWQRGRRAYDGASQAGFPLTELDGTGGCHGGQTGAPPRTRRRSMVRLPHTVGGAGRSATEAGIEELPTIPKPFDQAPTPYAWANDVSDDGGVIVGASGVYQTVAVQWIDGDLFELGSIANAFGASQAYGVSGNGLVIVGEGQDQTYTYRAFRWTETTAC